MRWGSTGHGKERAACRSPPVVVRRHGGSPCAGVLGGAKRGGCGRISARTCDTEGRRSAVAGGGRARRYHSGSCGSLWNDSGNIPSSSAPWKKAVRCLFSPAVHRWDRYGIVPPHAPTSRECARQRQPTGSSWAVPAAPLTRDRGARKSAHSPLLRRVALRCAPIRCFLAHSPT